MLKIKSLILIIVLSMSFVAWSQNSTLSKDIEYHIYTIEAGEGLYSVSKKFGVTQDEIIAHNPSAKDGLKAGQTLLIPKKNAENRQVTISSQSEISVETAYAPKFIIHTVEPHETLYSICRMHAMDINDVVRLNPGAEKKLKVGDKILLPLKEFRISGGGQQAQITPEISDSSSIKIVFLLPFMLQNVKDAASDRFLEFYAGALLAVLDAKKQGAHFKIYAYDTEKSESKVLEILALPELKKADLIVGPAYSNQIEAVSDFAKTNRINTIIPFSANVAGIANNPYLFQFNPNQDIEAEFTAEICKNAFVNKQITLVYLRKNGIVDDGSHFVEKLENQLVQKGVKNFSRLEIASEKEILTLNNNKENVLFFGTDRLSQVQPFFALLDSLAQTAAISLYCQYSWQVPANRRFRFFSISPFALLDEQSALQVYTVKFRDEMGWLPNVSQPRFDLLGYDLTGFFIQQMLRNLKNFAADKLYFDTFKGVQSELQFERSSGNAGFVNRKLYYSDK